MPFVKKTDQKNIGSATQAPKKFVARLSEQHFFTEAILKPDEPTHNIISISGNGGVGKSTLLARFRDLSGQPPFKDYCLTASVDERQITPAIIMEKLMEQLKTAGCDTNDFDNALKRYKESLRKAAASRDAGGEALFRTSTDLLGTAVEDALPGGKLLHKGVEGARDYLISGHQTRQMLKEAERLENPVGDLTTAFVTELNKLTKTQVTLTTDRTKRNRRILLFFDTFEQLAPEVAPWLLDQLLEANVNSDVVLVIAGRDSIMESLPDDPKRWLPYQENNVIYPISLNSFTHDETVSYLAGHIITNLERVELIWQLSKGLPLYLGFFIANPSGDIDPTSDVIENYLRWEKDPVRRRLAEEAALFSRPFNQDELAAFDYILETDRTSLYRWLTSQPFVRSNFQDGRHIYHDEAREMFTRHLYARSKNEYYKVRRSLTTYYRTRLTTLETEQDKQVYISPEWLELSLALIYQLLLLPDETSNITAIEQVIKASEEVKEEQNEEIIILLRELAENIVTNRINLAAREISQNLVQYIDAVIETAEFIDAATFILQKVIPISSFSQEYLASIYNSRGRSYYQQAKYHEALQDCNRSIELKPSDTSYYIGRVVICYQFKKFHEVIKDCNQLIEQKPNIAAYYNIRGSAYTHLEKYKDAIEDYNRAIELQSDEAIYYIGRGDIYDTLKNYEQALDDFNRAIKLNPADITSYNRRGNIYYALKEYKKAIDDFTRAIDLDPKVGNFYWNRGLAHDQLEEYKEAIEDYNRAIELEPNEAIYYTRRGNVYYRLGKYKEAIEDYSQAIELKPDNVVYYHNRGDIFRRLKDYNQAMKDRNYSGQGRR